MITHGLQVFFCGLALVTILMHAVRPSQCRKLCAVTMVVLSVASILGSVSRDVLIPESASPTPRTILLQANTNSRCRDLGGHIGECYPDEDVLLLLPILEDQIDMDHAARLFQNAYTQAGGTGMIRTARVAPATAYPALYQGGAVTAEIENLSRTLANEFDLLIAPPSPMPDIVADMAGLSVGFNPRYSSTFQIRTPRPVIILANGQPLEELEPLLEQKWIEEVQVAIPGYGCMYIRHDNLRESLLDYQNATCSPGIPPPVIP